MAKDDGLLLSARGGEDDESRSSPAVETPAATPTPAAETTPSAGHGSGSSAVRPPSTSIAHSGEVEATIEAELTRRGGEGTASAVGSGYAIGEILGRGGEGEVRAARQLAFDRVVAVKQVRRDGLDANKLRRFHAEALITALLEHPHIIPIYDFRVDDGGDLQLVMKQIKGMTWKDLLRPRTEAHQARAAKLHRADHLDILLKVCDALAFAHARGFIHRDLKPENVMVGEHGEVLVMDWGCAVSFRDPPPHALIPTVRDLEAVSGTPAFMAPEQARNDTARMGVASDVYLLGGILYQILTGRPPHRGSTVREAMGAAMRGEVVPPGERIGKAVDEELSAIAMAALAADPAERTQDVPTFAAALRGYRDHVEALALLREARKRLQGTKRDTVEAEDSFRRALSACEQAIEIWPEHVGARKLLLKTALAYAQHGLTHGSYRTARTMATTALATADALGEAAAKAEAEALSKRAVRAEAESRSRERALRRTRTVLNWGGPILTTLLAVGLVWAWSTSKRAQSALAQAQTNLEAFTAERDQRLDRERLAIPALVAQAREAVGARDFDTALRSVGAALDFDPDHEAARLLHARVLIVLGRRDEAVADLERHLAAKPADADSKRLRDLLRHGGDDAKTQQAIADLFLKQGASAEAEALFTGVDQQEAVWRDRLTAAWPGFDQRWLIRREDGTFALAVPRGRAGAVTSLDPLKGMPLVSIDLFGARRLRDLAPLAGMPLEEVRLTSCGIRDLSSLAGMRLRTLEVGGGEISDLAPLRGMPLEEVDLSGNTFTTLEPLAGMKLRRLNLWDCAGISDLAPLRNAALEWLSLGGERVETAPKVVSLRPLEGQAIHYLDLRGNRQISDFSILTTIRPKRLILDGTRISDLSPFWSMGLTQLSIRGTEVQDIGPVARHPLTQVDLDMRIVRGMDDLRANPTIVQVNRMPAGEFWALRDVGVALAARNEGFTWNITGKVEDGAVVELDINRCQASELAPLSMLKLRRLVAWSNPLADGRPLRGMPLREAILDACPITDVDWLDQSPIEELRISGSKVSNLAPLRRKPLRLIHLSGSKVGDLRPVLQDQLEEITCTPKDIDPVSLKTLRGMKSVKRIGVAYNQIWPADEFWQRFDRGDFK